MTRRRNQASQPEQSAVEPGGEAEARAWLNAAFRRQSDSESDSESDEQPQSMNALIRRACGRPDAA